MLLRIDMTTVHDWDSFHAVFQEALGFPDFYGANMDAWIDCMSYLDDPTAEMTQHHVNPGETLTLQLDGRAEFFTRCPEQHAALLECVDSVNERRAARGEPPLLSITESE